MHLSDLSHYINDAYKWVCHKRTHHSSNSDIWDLRHHWASQKDIIFEALKHGTYRFSPRQLYRFKEETISLYSSKDSLVLKMIALYLGEIIQKKKSISTHCYHIKHHGGLKKAVRETKKHALQYKYVFKSDIQSYYESIEHDIICDELLEITNNKPLCALIKDALKTPSTWGGLYFDCENGIKRGSPLSPLLAAIALNKLDKAMTKFKGVFYARYMDDWVVLCNSKRKLRKIVKLTHRLVRSLGFTLHPDKTYVGNIFKGFDFLGYHFKKETLNIAKITLQRALAKLRQLYEQGETKKALALYWQRFLKWVKAGVGDLLCGKASLSVRVLKKHEAVTQLIQDNSS